MPSLDEFLAAHGAGRPALPIPLDEPVPLEELQTPALILDLDRFEANLDRMQEYLDSKGIALRAHTKMHKCPLIAREQVRRGALGVCAAKVSEAEVMLAAGLGDVLITSPIVTPDKLRRFIAARQRHAGLKLVLDNEAAATQLAALAAAEGLVVDVFIDLDPGMGRTGVAPGEPALALARHILEADSLNFLGLQMYAGNCMHIDGFEARRSKYTHIMQRGVLTRALFEEAGIPTPVVSGGGTGTYNIEPALGFITELQAGSYPFMDIEYREIGGEGSGVFADFDVSLFVLVTAISQPQSRLITVDGGFKSFASDKMPPQFRDLEGVVYHWGGDEHGIIQLDNPSRAMQPGDKLAMLTPHCDPTVNLHDFYFPYRDGVVSEIWPITARGLSF